MRGHAITNCIIAGCFSLSMLGCARTQSGIVETQAKDLLADSPQHLGESRAASLVGEAKAADKPGLAELSVSETKMSIVKAKEPADLTTQSRPALKQQREEYVNSAQQMLKEGDLAEAATLLEQAAAIDEILKQTQEAEQALKEYVKAAAKSLKKGDLTAAAVSLEQATALEPESKLVSRLQAQLQQARRRADDEARRALVRLYSTEGSRMLDAGDFGRALAYFEAAQGLDPTSRDIFKLIERAHETQYKLVQRANESEYKLEVKQRGRQFKERINLAREAVLDDAAAKKPSDELAKRALALSKIEPEPLVAVSKKRLSEEERPAKAQAPAQEAAQVLPTERKAVASEKANSGVEAYKIHPEDVLQITVFEEPDLTTKTRVTSDEEITFPLIGRISVAGLSVTQIQEKVTSLLADGYLVDPHVQVFIEAYHPRNVFVTGAVNQPGSYAIPTEKATTVMETIAMAGGFNEVASPNGTRIVRIDNGHEKTIRVKANDIIKKGDKAQDVAVYPNDIIFVPESFF